MSNGPRWRMETARGRTRLIFVFFSLVILTLALSGIVPEIGRQLRSSAAAAEVDAQGILAPVGFADIIARVKPAVVGVRVKVEEATPSDDTTPFPSKSPFQPFFRQFGIPVPETRVPRTGVALGSGFFISGDGYIVTDYHVVANGTEFEVTTDGGNTYDLPPL